MKQALIATHSGNEFDIFNMTADNVEKEDIFMALPNICRFGARIPKHYSVAQHSVELCNYLRLIKQDVELARIALLHDGCEAYVGDMIYPLRKNFPEFQKLELFINKLIFEKFDIDDSRYDEFDVYDKEIVVNEAKALDIYEQNKSKPTMRHLVGIDGLTIVPKPINKAAAEYKLLFEELIVRKWD